MDKRDWLALYDFHFDDLYDSEFWDDRSLEQAKYFFNRYTYNSGYDVQIMNPPEFAWWADTYVILGANAGMYALATDTLKELLQPSHRKYFERVMNRTCELALSNPDAAVDFFCKSPAEITSYIENNKDDELIRKLEGMLPGSSF